MMSRGLRIVETRLRHDGARPPSNDDHHQARSHDRVFATAELV